QCISKKSCGYDPHSKVGDITIRCVKSGIPFYTPSDLTRVVTVNFVWRCFAASFGGFKRDFPRILRTIWKRDVRCVPEKSVGGGVLFRSGRVSRCCIPSDERPETVERSRLYSCSIPTGHESVPDRSRSTWGVVYICPWLWRLRCLRLGVL